MSVAEMKVAVMAALVKLEDESAVKEILAHLKKLNEENPSKDVQATINEQPTTSN